MTKWAQGRYEELKRLMWRLRGTEAADALHIYNGMNEKGGGGIGMQWRKSNVFQIQFQSWWLHEYLRCLAIKHEQKWFKFNPYKAKLPISHFLLIYTQHCTKT